MIDTDLSTVLWAIFVFASCALLGFGTGVMLGDHYQKQFTKTLAGHFHAALTDLYATLNRVKQHEREREQHIGGFAFGTSGAPAARAYERERASDGNEPPATASGPTNASTEGAERVPAPDARPGPIADQSRQDPGHGD